MRLVQSPPTRQSCMTRRLRLLLPLPVWAPLDSNTALPFYRMAVLKAAEISGEVYLAFASDDPYVPQSVPDALLEIMTAAGVEHRVEIYPDTEHGFAFPQRAAYKKDAAERHWERMFALFDRRLRA